MRADWLPKGTCVRFNEQPDPNIMHLYGTTGIKDGDIGHITEDWEFPRAVRVQWLRLGAEVTAWIDDLEIITP